MEKIVSKSPVILCLSAHDPSGGAGLQADIEAIRANGCFAVSVITALTEQSLMRGVKQVLPQDPGYLLRQIRLINDEYPIAAMKIGVIGSDENILAISQVLDEISSVPIILDPVLAPTSGDRFVTEESIRILREELISKCTLITPNKDECLRLGNSDTIPSAINNLHADECNNILITSTTMYQSEIEHTLYQEHRPSVTYKTQRLPGEYHGSGCTLSATITAKLAHQYELPQAISEALEYTSKTLQTSEIQSGQQFIPNRFPNAD